MGSRVANGVAGMRHSSRIMVPDACPASHSALLCTYCRLSACSGVLYECETQGQLQSDSVQRDHSDVVDLGSMS